MEVTEASRLLSPLESKTIHSKINAASTPADLHPLLEKALTWELGRIDREYNATIGRPENPNYPSEAERVEALRQEIIRTSLATEANELLAAAKGETSGVLPISVRENPRLCRAMNTRLEPSERLGSDSGNGAVERRVSVNTLNTRSIEPIETFGGWRYMLQP